MITTKLIPNDIIDIINKKVVTYKYNKVINELKNIKKCIIYYEDYWYIYYFKIDEYKINSVFYEEMEDQNTDGELEEYLKDISFLKLLIEFAPDNADDDDYYLVSLKNRKIIWRTEHSP